MTAPSAARTGSARDLYLAAAKSDADKKPSEAKVLYRAIVERHPRTRLLIELHRAQRGAGGGRPGPRGAVPPAGKGRATASERRSGAPGARGEGFYAAYFRDLDGNKLNAFCMA